jgi:hypothetical protein
MGGVLSARHVSYRKRQTFDQRNPAGAIWLQFLGLLRADDVDQRCQNPDCPDLRPALPHREEELDEQGRMRRAPMRRYFSKRCADWHYNKTVTLSKRRKRVRYT